MKYLLVFTMLCSFNSMAAEYSVLKGTDIRHMAKTSKRKITESKKMCKALKKEHRYDMIRICNEFVHDHRRTYALWTEFIEADTVAGLTEESLTAWIDAYQYQLAYLKLLLLQDLGHSENNAQRLIGMVKSEIRELKQQHTVITF